MFVAKDFVDIIVTYSQFIIKPSTIRMNRKRYRSCRYTHYLPENELVDILLAEIPTKFRLIRDIAKIIVEYARVFTSLEAYQLGISLRSDLYRVEFIGTFYPKNNYCKYIQDSKIYVVDQRGIVLRVQLSCGIRKPLISDDENVRTFLRSTLSPVTYYNGTKTVEHIVWNSMIWQNVTNATDIEYHYLESKDCVALHIEAIAPNMADCCDNTISIVIKNEESLVSTRKNKYYRAMSAGENL